MNKPLTYCGTSAENKPTVMYAACGANRMLLLKGPLTGYVMHFTTLCAIPNAGHNPRVIVMHIIISSDVCHMIGGLSHSSVRFRRIKPLCFGLKKIPVGFWLKSV